MSEHAAHIAAWVPVAERLPDDEITVMVATVHSDEPVWMGWHDESGWYSVEATPINVSHWMPLPTPPKESA